MSEPRIEDVYVSTGKMPWTPFSDGIDLKVLRVSPETGAWTVYFRCQEGASFARHKHLGAGEYFMIKGCMKVRGGREAGGITAEAGDYGYEPSGIIHDETCFTEESEFYFTNYGAIQFIDEKDAILHVLDWQDVMALGEAATKAAAAE